MGQIIEFPDSKKLKETIRKLRKQLENLVLERDELRFVVCENIKTAYMLIFGGLEYNLYEAYCKFLRLRRKKEMIQAKINRQEKVQAEVIERMLDKEFSQYRKKLDEKISDMNRALARSKMDVLSEEDTAEVKKLYRSIVKNLHPDLNPKTTEAEKELFYQATEAYEQGDLCALQVIYQIADKGADGEEMTSSLSGQEKEKQRLEKLLDQVKAEIEKIKTSPPYIWKIYVEDERQKKEKLSQLQKELESFQAGIRTQEDYIRTLQENK